MNKFKGLLYMLKIDILRTFRDIKYITFIIALPIILYLLYTQMFNPNIKINGITWSAYSMIALAAFGIIGNAVSFLGVRVQGEHSENWYQFLKVSSIPEFSYNISRSMSYIVLSFIIICLMFIVGAVFKGAILEVSQYILCTIALLIGSLVFISLALIVSCMGSAAQPLGTLLYLVLSFVGGLWLPVDSMPSFMQKIAKWSPSYNYANIVWSNLGGQAFPWGSVLNLIAWMAIFLAIYYFILKVKKNKT